MNAPSLIDRQSAHRAFSAECFNATWGLIEKGTSRTKEDDLAMLSGCYSSLWHWNQREDCSPKNLSIAYWQLSRVHAILGHAELSLHFANLCLDTSPDADFYKGYAFEAVSRAAMTSRRFSDAAQALSVAKKHLQAVTDPQERAWLEEDLQELDTKLKTEQGDAASP